MQIRMWIAAVIVMWSVFSLAHSAHAQENADVLKYSLKAVPGDIQVNRMPGTDPPRSYQENFSFEVADSTRTDYKGSASSCKTYDVEVATIDTPDQPVWIWSKGKKFCQHVTTVNIAAGKTWKQTIVWKFTTADIKDGKYRATATFVPSKQKATVDFEITSVQ
jgi:hypothetical protein